MRKQPCVLENISDAALMDRLAYNVGNGTVEGLVASPAEWPGVQAAKPLLRPDRTAKGIWIDRAQFWDDGRPSKVKLADYEEEVSIKLSKIPTHRHLSDAEYVEFAMGLCDLAEDAWKQKDKGPPLGRDVVTRQGAWKKRTPYKDRTGCSEFELSSKAQRERRGERTPAPHIHVECPKIRLAYMNAYRDNLSIMAAHREALADLLREVVPGDMLCPTQLAPMIAKFPRIGGG